MQNNLICSDIIPQNQEYVNIEQLTIIVDNFMKRLASSNLKRAKEMNIEEAMYIKSTVDNLNAELTKTNLINTEECLELKQKIHVCSYYIEQKIIFANKEIKHLIERTIKTFKATSIKFSLPFRRVIHRILASSRAVRSHNKTSNFSKSSSGDSGDPDQPPEPPRQHPYLILPQKRNSYIHSWRTTPNSCLLVGGGQYD